MPNMWNVHRKTTFATQGGHVTPGLSLIDEACKQHGNTLRFIFGSMVNMIPHTELCTLEMFTCFIPCLEPHDLRAV